MSKGRGGRVRYRAFGAIAVQDVEARSLNRRRERNVLAVLMSAHGAPIPAERLVAEVWHEDSQALGALQVAVSRLRSDLEPERVARQPARRLVSTAGGYALVAEVDDVDVWEFESLVESALAASEPGTRLEAAERAEDLWTGDPYPDCDVESVALERDRLVELRLTLHELRGQALLDLDRAEAAVLALSAVAPQHPYRERLWALLALAQYRCARQADALDTLRRLRERLAEDLGVDPTPDVQHLEQQVLRQDSALNVVPASAQSDERPPPAPGPSRPQPQRPELSRDHHPTVGREAAVEVVTAALERLVADPAATGVLGISGEPGIGKSRLVNDLEVMAADRGIGTVVGRCHEGDFAPPLWPWLAVVRHLVGDAEPDPLLLPLLEGVGQSSDVGAGTTMRMYDAVAGLLAARATLSGLVVVIEDIHWADVSSLRLLGRVVDLSPPGVLVVTTRRTTEMQADDALVETMAAMARKGGERLRLDGLDTASVSRLLLDLLGPHDEHLDTVIDEATNGNPFFVHEYARLLQSRPDLGSVDPADLPVPDGVRDVLRLRLARLPEKGRTLLVHAAVLGRAIDPDSVAAMADESVDTVLDLLDLGLASGLLEERGRGYAFAHALTRETVYGEVSAARRMRLHARAATVLEDRVGDQPDQAAAIAHHAAMAAPLGEEQTRVALVWLFRSAQVAQARQAHVEALALWRRAADIATGPTLAGQRLQARCGEAETLLRLGSTVEATDVVEQVVVEARAHERWDLVADAASILNQAGVWSWRQHGETRESFTAVLTEALGHVDVVREARLSATLMVEHGYAWDGAKVEEYSERAVRLAREIGDPALLREVLFLRYIAALGRRSGEQRVALTRELLDLEPGGEVGVAALFHHGVSLYEAARVAEADAVIARCAEKAAELRHNGVDIPLAWWFAARARDREDPAARELTDRALELQLSQGFHGIDVATWVHAAYTRSPGRPVPENVRREALDRGSLTTRAAVAWAVLEDGHRADAYELLGPANVSYGEDYAIVAARACRVGVLATTGPREELAAAVEELRPYEGRPATHGSIDHLGAADYFLALGVRALGDHAEATRLARNAVELLRRLDTRPWLRRAEALVAELESMQGAD